jgi:hypothetical protein
LRCFRQSDFELRVVVEQVNRAISNKHLLPLVLYMYIRVCSSNAFLRKCWRDITCFQEIHKITNNKDVTALATKLCR